MLEGKSLASFYSGFGHGNYYRSELHHGLAARFFKNSESTTARYRSLGVFL